MCNSRLFFKKMFVPYDVISILMATLHWLVVWNMAFIFPYIGNVIIPTDELMFFRGVGIPPTSYIAHF